MLESQRRTFGLYGLSEDTDIYGAPDGCYTFLRDISGVLSLGTVGRDESDAADTCLGQYVVLTGERNVEKGMRLKLGSRFFEVDYVNDGGALDVILALSEIYGGE